MLGPGYTFEASDSNLYVGDTGWHGDYGWYPSMLQEGGPDPKFVKSRYHPGLKLAFYLDPVTRDTGCLRVIPGGHIRPFHESLGSLYYYYRISRNFSQKPRSSASLLKTSPAMLSSPNRAISFFSATRCGTLPSAAKAGAA